MEFVLLPTGPGEPRRIAEGLPADFHGATWLPDSRSFVFSGSSPGQAARLYDQDIEGAPAQPLTEADVDLEAPVVSPDGLTIAAIDAYGEVTLVPRRGGGVRPLPGVEEGEIPIQWRTDGQALYVYRPNRLPVEIFEVDVISGQRRRVREIVLPDVDGRARQRRRRRHPRRAVVRVLLLPAAQRAASHRGARPSPSVTAPTLPGLNAPAVRQFPVPSRGTPVSRLYV